MKKTIYKSLCFIISYVVMTIMCDTANASILDGPWTSEKDAMRCSIKGSKKCNFCQGRGYIKISSENHQCLYCETKYNERQLNAYYLDSTELKYGIDGQRHSPSRGAVFKLDGTSEQTIETQLTIMEIVDESTLLVQMFRDFAYLHVDSSTKRYALNEVFFREGDDTIYFEYMGLENHDWGQYRSFKECDINNKIKNGSMRGRLVDKMKPRLQKQIESLKSSISSMTSALSLEFSEIDELKKEKSTNLRAIDMCKEKGYLNAVKKWEAKIAELEERISEKRERIKELNAKIKSQGEYLNYINTQKGN